MVYLCWHMPVDYLATVFFTAFGKIIRYMMYLWAGISQSVQWLAIGSIPSRDSDFPFGHCCAQPVPCNNSASCPEAAEVYFNGLKQPEP